MKLRDVRKRYLPKEEILFENKRGAISYDLKNGFLCLDWRGAVNRQERKAELERALTAICARLSLDLHPDLQVVKGNFYRLLQSINRKVTAKTRSNELSVVLYPSDLISRSSMRYIFEKYSLPEA